MAFFQSPEIYKIEMYDRRYNRYPSAYIDLLVLDNTGTVYLANIIGQESKVKSVAEALQEGKTGQVVRAEGSIYENGHIRRSLYGYSKKKNFYDEEVLKIEDLTQLLLVSKNSKPDIKARSEWKRENDLRIESGEEPLPLPSELSELILAWDGDYVQQVYDILYDRYNTPMLPEWKDIIVEECVERGYYEPLQVFLFGSEYKLDAGLLRITEEQLEEIISENIKNYTFEFAVEEDDTVEPILKDINSPDEYITHFGADLGKIIKETVNVRFDPDRDKHHPAFHDLNLWANEHGLTGYYPPQANAIMGGAKTLEEDNYVIVNGEMGVGKTLIGPGTAYITEAMLQKVDNNPKPQRVLVLSPAIMVEKWEREIMDRVPNAEVYQIKHWTDVKEIEERTRYIDKKGKVKYHKPKNWEFYIISSETPKFTFPMEPIRDWRTHRKSISFRSLEEVSEKDIRIINRMIKHEDNKYHIVPQRVVNYTERVRFVKEEILNGATGNYDVIYTKGDTGYYCPYCGGPLTKRGGQMSDRRFFDSYNKSSKKWTKKLTAENWVCKNEVDTRTLPKHMIRDWTYDKNQQRWVPKYETQKCGFVLWQPEVLPQDSGYRKVSPAWYINKRLPRGFFKYLIADEVHEYKSGDSSVGQAFGQLINHTEKQILLTGTLIGGMSKDIFYLLARLNPKGLLKEGITYKDESAFNQRYGVSEHSFRLRNGQSRRTTLQKPGISPHLYPMHLMRNTVFLELNDMGYALPPYTEVPVVVDMDARQKQAYEALASEIRRNLNTTIGLNGFNGVSILMNALYQYADAPFNVKDVVAYDQNGERHVLGSPLNFEKDEFIPPKVLELINNIDKELYNPDPIRDHDGNIVPSPKRKSLVYVKYTGKEAYTQMDTYLYDILKRRGYNVGILRNGGSYDGIKMPKTSRDREAWLEEMMEKYDWDILITNPRLVKVGLDLLAFPNIHFFQMDYSTYDYMQASRRSWRIKQTQPVKVYTYVYHDTIQEQGLQHIAKKIDAALAMQGKFSEEGLRAMADSTDGFNALAKQLMKEDILEDVETVHDIFARKNQSFEEMQSVEFQEYEGYVMNPIEGGIETVRKIAAGLIKKVEEDHKAGIATAEDVKRTRQVVTDYLNMFDEITKTVDVKSANKGVQKKKQAIEGQVALDLFALV